LLGRDLVSIGVLPEERVNSIGLLYESRSVCRKETIVYGPSARLSEHIRAHRTWIRQQPEKTKLCEAAKH
jgi:hypothetical protein